jgi:hypothetical protein
MVTRRGFSLLATLVGLSTLVGPRALPRAVRELGLLPAEGREPLVGRIEALCARLDRGELTPEAFVREVHARFAEVDLPAELQDALGAPPAGDAVSKVWRQRDRALQRTRWLMLFFIPAGHAQPAHAHHNVASAQCVVRGRLHVRQYARVRRLDPHTLALRPVSDTMFAPQQTILTTEFLDNVHWFGAETEPAIVLNCAANGGMRDTFDPLTSRPTGRYYVDATSLARADDLIAAPELDAEEARTRFATHALSEFASLLPAAG